MKRIIAITIFLTQISLNAYSQNGTIFNYHYNPNRTYIQTIEQKEYSEIIYLGDSAFKKKLSENKIKEFESSQNSQLIETSIKTDSSVNDSVIKMTFNFTKNLKNNKPSIAYGKKIFAHCRINKLSPIVDSVLGMTKEESKSIIDIARSTILTIDFPEKKLAVGEVFFKTYPLTFPGKDNEAIIVSIGTGYKLLSIENGIAKFEIKQVYRINLGTSKIHPVVSGQGNGILLFDVKENFYTKYDLNTKLIYTIKKENYTIQTTTNSNLSHKVRIISK